MAKGKWYPEGSIYFDWDKTGITDAFIGCAYDSQCAGFVSAGLAEAPAVYNGAKSVVSKSWNWAKKFFRSDSLVKDTGNALKNTKNLRKWAKKQGWEKVTTDGGVEMWGVRNEAGVFSWRLKLKPQASPRSGLGPGSNQPRFDARLDLGNYINPFTGKTGGRSIGSHIPLGK